eukprot:3528703-Pyramimonas_sp.AAC.1
MNCVPLSDSSLSHLGCIWSAPYPRRRLECPAACLEGLGGDVDQRAIVGTSIPWAGWFAAAGL